MAQKIIPDRCLFDSLLRVASIYPDKIAVIAEGKSYTYAEFNRAVIRLANALLDSGFRRGDRCVVYMDNTWVCVVSIYAVILAGGVFVVVNPQTKQDKLEFILNDCTATIFITDAHLYPVFGNIIGNVESLISVISSGDLATINDDRLNSYDQVISDYSENCPVLSNVGHDLAALVYTSGSTGHPKGVMLTHRAMTFARDSLVEYLRLGHDDRILLVLPMAFDYGLYQLLMSVQLGATLILERSFTYPAQIFKRMIETNATVFPAVPTIYSMMIAIHSRNKLSFPSIGTVTNTAAALPSEYIDSLMEIFPNALIFKMYGLTECKRVCYLEPELVDKKPMSVGKAIPGTEVFVLNENMEPVEVGQTGMLYIRGQHIMSGYWNQPEKSNEVLIDWKLPGEKILCSNDWFRIDEDGDLYFQGRSDDIIKTRGEKVSPVEVENVIYGISGVTEVAVIGVPDEVFGEAVKCFVVINKNIPDPTRVIKKACTENLENFMIPKYIEIVDSLPKTNTGKISKKGLK